MSEGGEFNVGGWYHSGPVRVCSKGLKAAVSPCKNCRPYNGSLNFLCSLWDMGLACTRVTHAGWWDLSVLTQMHWTYIRTHMKKVFFFFGPKESFSISMGWCGET